ncbi:Hypp4514 [Branchiostoma lanceolatum]|uniref:Hypp4514 protein n=1 Tax=Branchiostoma lanceolatum TaxID=7740 RepID=A0A8K0A9W7_BRALA|nr:Hypp4514 [Branchiostoma lanceolatum]
MLNTKSRRAKDIYRNKNKEVKRSARRDKRAYVVELASEAERAATRGELSKVYRITKTLCNQNSACSVPIKDKQGKLLTNEKEQAERWAQHFEEVLNRPEPDEPADPAPSEDIPINTDPPTLEEGCILSPILFLITIDWVMRATTSDRPRGIKWTPNMYLEDLDFADDLAALSSVRTSLQEKTDRLSDRGKQTGLYINKKKTQVMYINTPTDPPISIDGEALEGVLIWDVTSGTCIKELQGMTDQVHTCKYSTEGTLLASGASEVTLMVRSKPAEKEQNSAEQETSTV